MIPAAWLLVSVGTLQVVIFLLQRNLFTVLLSGFGYIIFGLGVLAQYKFNMPWGPTIWIVGVLMALVASLLDLRKVRKKR
jgi:hypothetical protein